MRNYATMALGVVIMAVTAASCSKGSSTSPSGGTPTAQVTIHITGQNGSKSFTPNPADAGGQTVVFKNDDTVVHHVQLNDGSLDTGDIAPGATSRVVTMPSTGTNYHCTLHGTMVGAVLTSSDEPPPPCTGFYCATAE
jgi:plastocyanin